MIVCLKASSRIHRTSHQHLVRTVGQSHSHSICSLPCWRFLRRTRHFDYILTFRYIIASTHNTTGTMATDNAKPGTGKSGLGTLIRMRELGVNELPRHPSLASQQEGAPSLQAFVSNAIEESNGFMTTYLPRHFNVKDEKKQSSPSTAPVKLLSHEIKPGDLPDGAKDAKASGK